MNVLPLTVFVGIVLVAFFVGLFLHATARRHAVSERDALLPLAEEKPSSRQPAALSREGLRNPPSP